MHGELGGDPLYGLLVRPLDPLFSAVYLVACGGLRCCSIIWCSGLQDLELAQMRWAWWVAVLWRG